MKLKLFGILFTFFFVLTGCDTIKKEMVGVYNLTQCKYEYNSISNLTVSGMNLSNGISATYIPKLTSIFTGQSQSIPLNFTLNLNVTNPGQSAAIMRGLQYIISVDNIQFTSGSVTQSLNVPAGGKQVLPLTIGFDLATLMKGESKSSVEKIAKNFIGLGNEKSNVSVQIKPTFLVGNQTIASPAYIPINFSFGGK